MFSLCNPSKHSHYISHFSQYISTPTKKCRSQRITYLGAGEEHFRSRLLVSYEPKIERVVLERYVQYN